MNEKILKKVFIIIFILMIALPLAFTNLKPNTVSQSENRTLANPAKLYNDDGTLNRGFVSDFERWFNDNVGFRSKMVVANARIQYYLFNRLSNNSDMVIGPKGEINYATDAIISDYQRFDLKSDDELKNIADSYQYFSDYLASQGIQYYYMQCWDKQTIYPEYFPKTVHQYGSTSKTDQIMSALKSTNINVIDFKEDLINAKKNGEPYSKWGDPTHWSQEGSEIGYKRVMEAINSKNNNRYKVLQDDDYDIESIDLGTTLFGGIHKVNISKNYKIKDEKAVNDRSLLTLCADDPRHSWWVNDSVNNNTRVLLLCDSYIGSFLQEDFAESFHDTILIWGDYSSQILELIDTYKPDIVINENAERCERTGGIIEGVRRVKAHEYALGDSISFKNRDNKSVELEVAGFTNPSDAGSWTVGDSATIELAQKEVSAANKLHMSFDISAIKGDKQRVNISVNGEDVAEKTLYDEGSFTIEFDNPKTKVLNISISTPDSVSPQQLGESDDATTYGVLLESMKVY